MVKAVLTGNKNLNSKHYLDSPKDGFVHKKKNQKFKQTPTGKIALLNGPKGLNNSSKKPQNQQRQSSVSPQKSLERNKEQKNVERQKNDKRQQELLKKQLDKKLAMPIEEEDDTDSEIEEDINEGIVLGDQSIMDESDNSEHEEESDDDESEKEENVPNILGNSLADESDEDDDDYEDCEEEEKEEHVQMKNGVKMFKGLKQANNSNDSLKDGSDKSVLEESVSDEDETEEEEDDDDDDEDEDEDDTDNDDDMNGSLEEELDEDTDDDDDDDDEEEDDDEDDELEDEDEADESALGLKALIDNTIVDDDEDDEDFVEPGENDEDDDISDEDEDEEEGESNTVENTQQKKNIKKNEDATLEQIKTDKKTVFVGNLPKDVNKEQLHKLFRKFGTIDTIRLRGIISKSLNIPKKVAAATKAVHPKLKSVYAYIKFVSEESAKAALSINGTVFEGNYLRVDISDNSENKYDQRKSVFLGNLRFNIDDNTVRNHFAQCGEIESVRIIRDNKTGIGKGFGYVNFKTEDAVALALELDGTAILNRNVRVKPNVEQRNKKDKHGKRSRSAENDKNIPHKKSKNNKEVPVQTQNKNNAVKRITEKKQKFEKKQTSPQQENTFQGQKADANKKKRKNKFEKKKKLLAEKLTAKPKKPKN